MYTKFVEGRERLRLEDFHFSSSKITLIILPVAVVRKALEPILGQGLMIIYPGCQCSHHHWCLLLPSMFKDQPHMQLLHMLQEGDQEGC